jgi:hypothetical protein
MTVSTISSRRRANLMAAFLTAFLTDFDEAGSLKPALHLTERFGLSRTKLDLDRAHHTLFISPAFSPVRS